MATRVTIEAESFSGLGNSAFRAQFDPDASGSRLIRLPFAKEGGGVGTSGTVRDSLTEVSKGSYNLEVHYFDENDGRSPVSLQILDARGRVTYSTDWVFDKELGSSVTTPGNLTHLTLKNVDVPANATLVLKGTADGSSKTGEFVRIDKVVFTQNEDGGSASTTSSTTSSTTTSSSSGAETGPVGPIIDLDGSANKVAANASAGTSVGIQVSAIDPDPGDAIKYLINDSHFEIERDGTVVVNQGASFKGFDDISFKVTAKSSDGSKSEKWFNVDITDAEASTVTKIASTKNGDFPARFSRLDNGINIDRSQTDKVSNADLNHLKSIGVEHVRLSLNSEFIYTLGEDLNVNDNHFKRMMSFAERVVDAGMAVVMNPSGGHDDPPYIDDPSQTGKVNHFAKWHGQFANYVNKHFDADDFFIEGRNEPLTKDNDGWWAVQERVLEEVRKAAPDFTFVASSNGRVDGQWSFIKSLKAVEPYDDPNVVYNIHYYNPGSFAQQGAAWNKSTVNLSGSYPGAEGYNAAKIKADMDSLAQWADKHDAYISVNEIGAINKAPLDERALYLHDVREAIDDHGWGWTVWSYNKSFGITNSDAKGNEKVLPEFQKALTWGKYEDSDPFKELYGTTYDDFLV